jgi:PEP-CTERM motif
LAISWTLNDGGSVSNFQNTFIEARISEPATMALLGVGLTGLGMVRRRCA